MRARARTQDGMPQRTGCGRKARAAEACVGPARGGPASAVALKVRRERGSLGRDAELGGRRVQPFPPGPLGTPPSFQQPCSWLSSPRAAAVLLRELRELRGCSARTQPRERFGADHTVAEGTFEQRQDAVRLPSCSGLDGAGIRPLPLRITLGSKMASIPRNYPVTQGRDAWTPAAADGQQRLPGCHSAWPQAQACPGRCSLRVPCMAAPVHPAAWL